MDYFAQTKFWLLSSGKLSGLDLTDDAMVLYPFAIPKKLRKSNYKLYVVYICLLVDSISMINPNFIGRASTIEYFIVKTIEQMKTKKE